MAKFSFTPIGRAFSCTNGPPKPRSLGRRTTISTATLDRALWGDTNSSRSRMVSKRALWGDARSLGRRSTLFQETYSALWGDLRALFGETRHALWGDGELK